MIEFTKYFDNYICPDDSISVKLSEHLYIKATIEYDYDTKIKDYDGYSEDDIKKWEDDKWWFGCMTLSGWYDDVKLASHLSVIGGLEINNDAQNAYLLKVANDLLPEALAEFKKICDELSAGLGELK